MWLAHQPEQAATVRPPNSTRVRYYRRIRIKTRFKRSNLYIHPCSYIYILKLPAPAAMRGVCRPRYSPSPPNNGGGRPRFLPFLMVPPFLSTIEDGDARLCFFRTRLFGQREYDGVDKSEREKLSWFSTSQWRCSVSTVMRWIDRRCLPEQPQ